LKSNLSIVFPEKFFGGSKREDCLVIPGVRQDQIQMDYFWGL
jgi:hypothetical protein